MFSDILRFAIEHHCNIIPNEYISYEIKYIDHHYSCKLLQFNP